jgi:hypothetical protein
VRCLLHLPIRGRLLNHIGISSKGTDVDWMTELLGTTDKEAEDEVRKTKGAHIRFVFLKELITRHLNRTQRSCQPSRS